MSGYNYDDEDGQFGDSDLVKRLRKEIEKRDQLLASKDQEFNELRGEVRRQSVTSILRDLGVKTKVANLVPADVEPTADAVGAWVKDWEDVFGSARSEAPQQTEPIEENQPPSEPNVSADVQAAWNRMQTGEASAGVSVPTGDDAQLEFLARAAKAAGGDADKYFAFLRGEENPT